MTDQTAELHARLEQADAVTAETKRLMERRTTTLRERAERAEAAIARVREALRTTFMGGPDAVRVVRADAIRAALNEAAASTPLVDRPFRSHRKPVNPTTPQVLAEIGYERTRQDAKWGEQNHPDGTGPEQQILPGWAAIDLANAARNACQIHADMGIVTWRDIFGEEACEALAESDPARLRAELVQVAAVAVNWIEAIDRRT